MRGNYIAVFIHAIWTTKYRLPILPKKIRYPLFKHVKEISEKKGVDLRIVNGVEDHVHCVFRLLPSQSFDKVVKDIKGESSRWLNLTFFGKPDWRGYLENAVADYSPDPAIPIAGSTNILLPEFKWQSGYGVVSVSPQNVGMAVRYVFNQEQHHAKQALDKELKLFEYYADKDWDDLE